MGGWRRSILLANMASQGRAFDLMQCLGLAQFVEVIADAWPEWLIVMPENHRLWGQSSHHFFRIAFDVGVAVAAIDEGQVNSPAVQSRVEIERRRIAEQLPDFCFLRRAFEPAGSSLRGGDVFRVFAIDGLGRFGLFDGTIERVD